MPSGGGLSIAPADGGMGGMGGTGGSGGGLPMGCSGLMACCGTLRPGLERRLRRRRDERQRARSAIKRCSCIARISSANRSTAARSAPTRPTSTATAFRTSTTIARRATSRCNPECNGSTLPLTTTNNQTIFLTLKKGETKNSALQIGFKVQNADVYFLMDTSDTMNQERDQLVSALTGCPVGQPSCANPTSTWSNARCSRTAVTT